MGKPLSIVITGPESSGKTSIAEYLAAHFNAVLVPEYSRIFLEQNGPKYEESDLLTIAKGQLALENEYYDPNQKLIFYDTSMLVMRIWSEVVFQRCHPWILKQVDQQTADLYLLCKHDIPWEPDPLRENEYDRDMLYDRYYNALQEMKRPFIILEGSMSKRCQKAIEAIQAML